MQQQAKKRSHPPTLPDLPVHYRVDITREISIHDPFANIVRVTLVYGQDTHHDIGFLGEPQIDHLVVNFPDNPPTHIPLTRAPTIQITGRSMGHNTHFHIRCNFAAP